MTQDLLPVPRRTYYHENMSCLIAMLSMNLDKDIPGWNGRKLFCYKLPEFQRPFVWTEEQSRKLIMKMYKGGDFGSFMINDSDHEELHNVIIDGQQRLASLDMYFRSKLAVPGEDGVMRVWGELPEEAKNRLRRISFPWRQCRINSEIEMREVYDDFNYSGTPHDESQRAIPLVSNTRKAVRPSP